MTALSASMKRLLCGLAWTFVRAGRLGIRRRSTLTCCRRTKISASKFDSRLEERSRTGKQQPQNFDKEADVDVWNENIFTPNRSFLETLLNRASYYDFAIAVFTADDTATIREQEVKITRDNVIFEFGLFLGRLGPNRAFVLHQEGVNLFSDWAGIAVASFTPRSNLVSAVGAACNTFREEMKVAIKLEKF